MKRINKVKWLFMLLAVIAVSGMILAGVSKADTTYDAHVPEEKRISWSSGDSNRTLIVQQNDTKDVWLTVNGSEPNYVTSNPIEIGFDADGTVWYISQNHYVYYVSVDLDGFNPITNVMYVWATNTYGTTVTPMYDNDVIDFIYDENNYITSYNTSDDIHHTANLRDLKNWRQRYPDGFPEPSLNPTETNEPGVTPSKAPDATPSAAPTAHPTNIPNTDNSTKATTPLAKGKTFTAQKAQYKVISADTKQPTVAYVQPSKKNQTSVTIPNTVKMNGVSYKVTSIAPKAFANNKKLKKVTVAGNVTSIGKNAFRGCKNLTKVTIKSTKLKASSVGANAFKGTNKKLVVKVPKSKVKAYRKFFKKKGNKLVKVRK